MHCIVTAGPTYEPLDRVRRLTNFSTGRLGTELANHLVSAGYRVTLLLGEQATYHGECSAENIQLFATTEDLQTRLQQAAGQKADAVFHAAAVSDFKFGKIWRRAKDEHLVEVQSGKISTREGTLVAELVPTPKIISKMRGWFPLATLVGWKFEVEGNRDCVVQSAQTQIEVCRTDACVANGPAYGAGFGLVTAKSPVQHLQNKTGLFAALVSFLKKQNS